MGISGPIATVHNKHLCHELAALTRIALATRSWLSDRSWIATVVLGNHPLSVRLHRRYLVIWPLYAALLGIVFVLLSVRTLRLRRRLQVAVGDGGNVLMLRAMRVHGNFAEYVPLGLLMIAGAEVLSAPAALVHGLGILLLVGRLVHAFGVSQEPEMFAYRVGGMALTFICYLVAAAVIIWLVIAGGA